METESKPSTPLDTGIGLDARPGEADSFALYRELIAIIIVFVTILAVIWMDFSGESEEELRHQNQKLLGQMQIARRQLAAGQLTQPEGNSALATYLAALKQFPKAPEITTGIEELGDGYLEMVARILEEGDLTLAETTLVSAEILRPHLQDPGYDRRLAEIGAELDRLKSAKLAARDAAARAGYIPQPMEIFQDKLNRGGKGPSLISLPGGRFSLGSPPDEEGRDVDEGPVTEVVLNPFAIGRTEITFAEYDAFAEATGRAKPRDNGWGRGKHPVINVTWRDARDYALWLGRETGHIYRLPTEAEWEYAARAATSGPFSTGSCLDGRSANIDDRDPAAYPGCTTSGVYRGKTAPVGGFQPNPWSLHDVHGNVREWTRDCWALGYTSDIMDGSALYLAEGGNCGSGGKRILRGGAWDGNAKTARVANRFAMDEAEAASSVGFRIVREFD